MANYKTVPNQKIVKVHKEQCNKQNLYATINLEAMEQAAQNLDAGAFKLWCYFAKNQNNFEFALSSKQVEQTFNIKIKQYNNAIAQLKEKGYLVENGGNNYTFREKVVITFEDNEEEKENHVITKQDNDVITFEDNVVITKGNNTLLPLGIRNNTYNTYNNTTNNTEGICASAIPKDTKSKGIEELFQKERFSALDFLNELERMQVAQQ